MLTSSRVNAAPGSAGVSVDAEADTIGVGVSSPRARAGR
jgi:hypothetical protein